MVKANCRKRMPVVPGRRRPHEHGYQYERGGDPAPVTSRMASEAALAALGSPSCKWRSIFSITTITSSTTRPVARVNAEERQCVDGKNQAA